MLYISKKDLLFGLLLTLLMSIPAAYEPGHFAKTLFVGAFMVSLAMSILLTWFTSTHTVSRMVVWTLVYLLFALENYVFFSFGSRFDPNILMLILQTNRIEAGEFFSVYLLTFRSLAFIACTVVIGLIPLWVKVKGQLTLPHVILTKLLIASVVAGGLSLPFLRLPFPLGKNTLMQVANNIQFAVAQHQEIDRMIQMLGKTKVTFTPSVADDVPAIVLVIGESHNKHHSSIYGYSLPTSPHSMQEQHAGNLIVFNCATTPTNGTSYAMRYIFSLKECDSRESDPAQYVLMPAIFKQAGFRVVYLDNQYTRSSGGSLDYSCGYFLNPSVINASCFDFRNQQLCTYDGDFVDLYQNEMSTEPKSLTIIHLKGQHFDASLRYPGNLSPFSSSDIQRPDLGEEQKRKVAEYDNATYYNDMVLAHILDVYKGKDAVVVYLSDHGEQIYDGPSHFFGRSFGSLDNKEMLSNVYEVPFMVWCSDEYIQMHPEEHARIVAASSKPVCTADVAYFLLDLASIDCVFQRKDKSYISPDFVPHEVKME